MSHLKGDKIIVFKKKRRKGYRVKNGHRQFFTELLIESVSEKSVAKKINDKKTKVVKSDLKNLKSNKVIPKKAISIKSKVKSSKKSSIKK